MSGIQIDVEARTAKAHKDLDQINRSLDDIKTTASRTSNSIMTLVKAFAAITAVSMAYSSVKRMTDEFTQLNNKVRLYTKNINEVAQVQSKLLELTIKNRSELSTTASIYGSLSKSMGSLSRNSDSVLRATSAIQQSMAISGGSIESSRAAMIQLGQGLASGVLRGEEFNSVMEQAPRLAKAIADGIGVSTGELRGMAEAGGLVSSKVFEAILSQSKKINKEFSSLTPTLEQLSASLKLAFRSIINEFLDGSGVLGDAVKGLEKLTSGFSDLSLNARVYGEMFNEILRTIDIIIETAGVPLKSVFSALFTQLKNALPGINFDDTLVEQISKALDKLQKLIKDKVKPISYFFEDMFSFFETPLDKAIKRIRRIDGAFDMKTVKEYGAAFEELAAGIRYNTDSIYASMTRFATNIYNAARYVARYFGIISDGIFQIKIGNIYELSTSVSELLDGFLGIGTSAIESVVSVLSDLYESVAKSGDVVKDIMHDTEVVIEHFIKFLKTAYKHVREFGEDVIDVFYKIWNDVVGHSWWPDTIDGVVEYASNLTERVRPYFDKFYNYLKSLFTDITKHLPSLDLSSISLDYSGVSDVNDAAAGAVRKLEAGISGALGYFGVDSGKYVSLFDSIADDFDTHFVDRIKTTLIGVTGLILAAIVPIGGAMNAATITALAGVITNWGNVVSDAFYELFGVTLSSSFGELVGTIIGNGAAAIIKAIPIIVNTAAVAIGDALRALTSSLLGTLPLGIGDLLKGIFDGIMDAYDSINIGPIVSLTAALMGLVGISKLLVGLKGFNSVHMIFQIFSNLQKSVGPDGIITKLFFGKDPKKPLLAITAIMTLAGSFDNLIGNSQIIKYGSAGLIGWYLFGGDPVNFVSKVWSRNVVPLIAKIRGAMSGAGGEAGVRKGSISSSIVENIIGTGGNSTSRIYAFTGAILSLTGALDSLFGDSQIIKYGTVGLLGWYAFGGKPEDLILKIKSVFSNVNKQVSTDSNGSILSGFTDSLKSNKGLFAGLAIAALLLFSTVSNAADDAASSMDVLNSKGYTLRDTFFNITDSVISWASENKSAVLRVLAILAVARAAYKKSSKDNADSQNDANDSNGKPRSLFERIGGLASSAKDRISTAYSSVDANMRKLSQATVKSSRELTSAFVGIASAMYEISKGSAGFIDIAQAVFTALTAVELAGIVFPKLSERVSGLIAKLAELALKFMGFSPLGAALAIAAGVGYLTVMFFGKGDGFFEKLDDAWERLLRFTKLKNETRQSTVENADFQRTSDSTRNFLEAYNVGQAPDFGKLRFDALSDKEKDLLKKINERYIKSYERATESVMESPSGELSNDYRQDLKESLNSLNSIIGKLASRIMGDISEEIKYLDEEIQLRKTSWLSSLTDFLPDSVFSINENVAKRGKLDEIANTKDFIKKARLSEELKNWERLSYRRNPSYQSLDLADESLRMDLEAIKRPDQIDPELADKFAKRFSNYKSSLTNFYDIRNLGTGPLSPYSNIDKDVAGVIHRYNRESLSNITREILAAEKREDAVRAFNGQLIELSENLKVSNSDFNKNALLSGDDKTSKRVIEISRSIKNLNKTMLENSRKGGIASEKELARNIKRMSIEEAALKSIERRNLDAFLPTNKIINRVNESLNLGLDRDSIGKIGESEGRAIKSKMQELEDLWQLYGGDIDIADAIFPPETDAKVVAAIKRDKSKSVLLAYLRDLEREIKDDVKKRDGFSIAINELINKSGINLLSGLENDGNDNLGLRVESAKKISKMQDDLQKRLSEINKPFNEMSQSEILDLMSAYRDIGVAQRDANERLGLGANILESYNDKLERMASLSGLSTNELLNIPKAITRISGITKSGFGFDISGNPFDVISGLSSSIANADRELKSYLTSPERSAQLRKSVERDKEILEAYGELLKERSSKFIDILNRMQNAGASFQLSDYFYIDNLKQLSDTADVLRNMEKSIKNMTIGSAEFKDSLARYSEVFGQFERDRAIAEASIALGKFNSGIYEYRQSAAQSAVGVNFDRSTYARNNNIIDNAALQVLGLNKSFSLLSENDKRSLAGLYAKAYEDVTTATEDAINLNDPIKGLSNILGKAGISIKDDEQNRLTAGQAADFSARAETIAKLSRIASDPTLSRASRSATQAIVDELSVKLSQDVEKATRRFDAMAIEVSANNFAKNVADSLENGVKDVLKGESTPKEFIFGLYRSFTSALVDAVVEGMMEPLTGEGSEFRNKLKDIGKSAFKLLSSVFADDSKSKEKADDSSAVTDSFFDNFTNKAKDVLLSVGGFLSDTFFNIVDSSKSVFDALSSSFDSLVSFVTGLFSKNSGGSSDFMGTVSALADGVKTFFKANGGLVFGPGTGTSDSIPAMLSNGEFVINAKATKRHRNLLEAINSGRIPRLANGGIVGSPSNDLSISTATSGSPVNQVFNINVTGDISRQTRAEIQRMIPQIANGVNTYSYERGRR